MVRALASHQFSPALNPGVAFCGLSLLFFLSVSPRGFSPGTPVFPFPQKPIFQIPIRPGNRYTKNHFVDVLPPNHDLCIFINLHCIKFIYQCVSNLLISLYRSLQCVPDVWSLDEWSNWLTPVHLPRRYDTMFYTCFLDKEPPVLVDEKEMTHSEVCS